MNRRFFVLGGGAALAACAASPPAQQIRQAPPVALEQATPAPAQQAAPAASANVGHLPLFVKKANVSLADFVAALDPASRSTLFNKGVDWRMYSERFAQQGASVGSTYQSFAAFLLSDKIVLKKLVAGEAANSSEYSIKLIDMSWIGTDGKTVGYFHRSQPYAGEMIAGFVNQHGRFVPLASLGCGNMTKEKIILPPIARPVCVQNCG